MVALGFGGGGGVGSEVEVLESLGGCDGGRSREGGFLGEGDGREGDRAGVGGEERASAVAVAGIGAQCAAEDGAVPHCCGLTGFQLLGHSFGGCRRRKKGWTKPGNVKVEIANWRHASGA